MNLLSHHNVHVVARFQRSTFAFLTPDHWSSSWEGGPKSGTANWQVMVIEISNEKGRDRYKVGHENLCHCGRGQELRGETRRKHEQYQHTQAPP